MEPEEGRLSVWVCREEKLVSGLTKRTTCADVVKVLLEDQNLQQGSSAAMLSGSPGSYCVVEKWRGFERTLPNKTKVLRLWGAWGGEQDNVRFVLVKTDASLPNTGPRSAEARVVQSRDSGGPGAGLLKGTTTRTCWTPGAPPANNPAQDKQRRVVRKAFRKLDKMNKKKDQDSVEKMETLVHMVVSQDHTIRQQVQRIQELDRDIERYETQVHFDRIQRHGVNYVQDTYLEEDRGDRDPAGPGSGVQDLVQLEDYARRCEEVLKLQVELEERELLVEVLTGEIQEELNRRWMSRRREETGAEDPEQDPEQDPNLAASSSSSSHPDVESDAEEEEEEVQLEEQRIRTQLDTSLYIGLRLKTDLDSLRGDLDLSLELWETKESELLELLARVEGLDPARVEGLDPARVEGLDLARVEGLDLEQLGGSVVGGGAEEQVRGLSKACSTNDDDSDTGLSSMHSQDSDNPPVCESLV
ncbi:ras association domain-containing protein 10 [Limanda limanda]|uniref:ras association domain-containing protein 10 n=1 Tax=Limanda limanda TaxID=27771 RepID=UPI0029C60A9D|nr:ras association domain-containing protein 10 [Limanda limanda]